MILVLLFAELDGIQGVQPCYICGMPLTILSTYLMAYCISEESEMIRRETSDPLAITHDSVLQGGTLPCEGKGMLFGFLQTTNPAPLDVAKANLL